MVAMYLLGKHEGGLNTNCLAYAPSGSVLASGKGGVRLWDLTKRTELREIESPLGTSAVTFAPDGTLVIAGGSSVRFLDPATGEERRQFQPQWCTAQCVLFADKGETLIAGGHSHGTGGDKVGHVYRWNLKTGRQRRHLPDLSEDVGFAALSPDGRYLACGGEKKSSWVCDLKGRSVAATWACRANGWRVVAFSPEGATLAITAGRTIELYDPAKLKRRRILRGHGDTVFGIAFTPDGRLLSGSADGTVRLWAVASSKQLAALDWGLGPINNVCVAPDGQTAAAGSTEGEIVVWDLDE
jgi:WD40 repeat protein